MSMVSDAAVRFGPVQWALLLNLELDHRSGSTNSSNFGLDFGGPVLRFGSVKFEVRTENRKHFVYTVPFRPSVHDFGKFRLREGRRIIF